MKVLVLSSLMGGQIAESVEVENYPGTEKASGIQMMKDWRKHAELFGTEIKQVTVDDIKKHEDCFKVITSKEEFTGKAVLFATGATHRHLGVKGEEEFQSRGVSYCPTCDGMFFKDKVVAVIGGGDAAVRGAQVMLQYASKVYLIHRRDEFRAEPMLVDQIGADPKTELVLKKTLKEVKGEQAVSSIVLDDDTELKVDGVFIEIGSDPNTELPEKLGIELEEKLIKVNANQSTNIPGIYAAGDNTTGSNRFRQVITAAAEGAIAAESAFEYTKNKKHCV